MASEHLVVLSTCPDRRAADEIAGALVEDGHAACVNIVPGMTSVYRWQGQVHRDPELLLIVKTTREAYRRVEETVLRLHPDELPEVIALPLQGGLGDYLHWVGVQTRQE